jgi:DNA invertase Pin-like site-specific DNA recombinase
MEHQVDVCRAAAASRGWTVTEVFTDHGVSGKKASRPGLDAVLEAARSGDVDVVLVRDVDRLARNAGHFCLLATELQELGVAVVAVNQGIDTTTPAGVVMAQLMAILGQWEATIIRRRQREGIDHARANGVHLGRPRAQVDVVAARHMLLSGMTKVSVARALGVSTRTLRRHLAK